MSQWVMKTLSEVCEINPRLPRALGVPGDQQVSFVPMAAVDEVFGAIANPQCRPFSEVKKGFTHFQDGDVLFAKITPCMENGKAAIATDLVGGLGFGSTEFHVLRSKGEVLPAWLFYFVRQPKFRADAKRNFTGTAGQQRVPTTFLASALIPFPPLPDQHRIVDLLSRAEGIVRLRREAEKKAAELIPALFLDMFGDPATNPKGWPVTTIGEIATYTRYGPRFPDRNYAAEGAHILRTTDMGYNGELRWGDSPILPMTSEETEKYSLRDGTLLITRTGATIGKLALFKGADRPCIAGAYLIELGIRADIVPDYVLHFFLSKFGQSQLVGGSRAVAQPNLNAPTIRSIRMPVPSASLQKKFSARLAEVASIQNQQSAAKAMAQAAFDALLAKAFA